MMKKKALITLGCLLLAGSWALAQVNVSSRTNTRLQDTRRWQKDIDQYQDVLETGDFPVVMEKLADCFRMTGELDKAENWYRKSIVSGNQSSSCRLNYARVLQSNGKYQEAKGQFKLYEEVTGEYEVGEKYIASCDMAMKIRDEQGRYEIRPVTELNTRYSDLVAINSKQELIFATRAKKREIGTQRKSRRPGSDYDLYSALKQGKGYLSNVKPIKGKANSRHDDVSAVKMPGSDLVLFTRIGDNTNATSPGVEDDKKLNKRVRILGARVRGNKWDEIENLPYNFADGSANFHPAIHPSGDLIIFASDRPGGYGGVDLYVVRREGGKWSQPRNLGPDLNTEGDELFPSFNEQGFLFFASDGHIGYGGLDLFTADMKKGRWENPANMGSGINSPKDDFGIVWDPKTSSGYFSSNRNAETGDDIFFFRRAPGITGQVFDGFNKESLAGSIVRLKDISGNEKIIITDGAGQFSEPCKMNTGYLVTVDAPGFHTWRDTFWTKSIPQGRDVNLDIYLKVEQVFEMSGRVVDARKDTLLPTAQIKIYKEGRVVDSLYSTNDSSDYKFRLTPNQDYSVVFEKENFVPRIVNLSIGNLRGVHRKERIVPMVPGEYVLVRGTIKEDVEDGKNLHRASVNIVDNRTQKIVDSTMTFRDGTFLVAIPWDSMSNYSIIGAKDGYFSRSLDVNKTESQEVDMDLALPDARFGLDFNLKVINYDYNQAELDLLSKKDLNEIYFFLIANPDAKLEVRSHTDARGTKKYNLELSRKRSESVIRYIQARRPLPDDRFLSWGFGEEYLLNNCSDGKPCDEETHALNRRTELKVVER